MPRADGGKEHPSSPGSSLAVRENQKILNLRVEVSRLTQHEGSPNGLAVATAVASVAAGVHDQRLPQQPNRATAATNGQRRNQHPAYSVPFDAHNPRKSGLLTDPCRAAPKTAATYYSSRDNPSSCLFAPSPSRTRPTPAAGNAKNPIQLLAAYRARVTECYHIRKSPRQT